MSLRIQYSTEIVKNQGFFTKRNSSYAPEKVISGGFPVLYTGFLSQS